MVHDTCYTLHIHSLGDASLIAFSSFSAFLFEEIRRVDSESVNRISNQYGWISKFFWMFKLCSALIARLIILLLVNFIHDFQSINQGFQDLIMLLQRFYVIRPRLHGNWSSWNSTLSYWTFQSTHQLILVGSPKIWFLGSFTFLFVLCCASKPAVPNLCGIASRRMWTDPPNPLGVFSPPIYSLSSLTLYSPLPHSQVILNILHKKYVMLFVLAYMITTEIGHLGCPDVCVASERAGWVGDEKKKEEAKWQGGHTAFWFHLIYDIWTTVRMREKGNEEERRGL